MIQNHIIRHLFIIISNPSTTTEAAVTALKIVNMLAAMLMGRQYILSDEEGGLERLASLLKSDTPEIRQHMAAVLASVCFCEDSVVTISNCKYQIVFDMICKFIQ